MSGSLRGMLFLKQGRYNVSSWLTIVMFKRKIFPLTINASLFQYFSIFFFVKRERKQDCRSDKTIKSASKFNLEISNDQLDCVNRIELMIFKQKTKM